MSGNLLILSPSSDQGQAIIRCFAGAAPGEQLAFARIDDGRVIAETSGAASVPIDDPLATYETVVPTTSPCTAYMLRRYGAVQVGDITMAASSLRWFDKPWSLAFAESHGVATPKTWHDVAAIPANAGPIFYKPGIEGVGGRRTYVATAAALPEEVRRSGSGFLMQEMIPGPEVYSYGFLADRGRVLAGIGLIERLSFPPSGGSAAMMDLCDDPALVERATRLIEGSAYSGWGLVEFKHCPRRNDYVLMEINPKFWASLELTLRTQPLFAKMLFGLDVAAEPIRRMYWPRRFFGMGVGRWPRHLGALAASYRARETIGSRILLAALMPYQVRLGLGRAIKGLRGRMDGNPARTDATG